jgi:hypothetical protein
MTREILEAIPIEQWLAFIAGVVAFTSLVAYGSWKLFTAWFEQKLEVQKVQLEAGITAKRIAQEHETLEMQNRLDATLFSQETIRIFASELQETRKEDIAQRDKQQAAYDRRDEQHIQHMAEITHVVKALQINTAATLELLKEHQDTGQVLLIRQEKLSAQNDVTHSKLSEISTDLSALASKLENMSVNRSSDRRTLDDIQASVLNLKQLAETMNERIITQPMPLELLDELDEFESAVKTASEVSESEKELNSKTNDESE